MRIDAPGTEVRGEPFRGNGRVAVAGESANFVEMVPGILGTLKTLGALGFGFLEIR